MVKRHAVQNGGQRSDTQRIMSWNGHMVLCGIRTTQPDMAASLSGHAVAKDSQLLDKLGAR